MELLTEIWQSVGTPLTILFWVYIVIAVVTFMASLGAMLLVLRLFWKDFKGDKR